MNLSDRVVSRIRTYAPIAVGALVSWLVSVGIDVGGEAQVGLTLALTAVLQGAYYTLARELEERWPQFGWLLGVAKQPAYSQLPPPQEAPAIVEDVPEAEDGERPSPDVPHPFQPERDAHCLCGRTARAQVHAEAA